MKLFSTILLLILINACICGKKSKKIKNKNQEPSGSDKEDCSTGCTPMKTDGKNYTNMVTFTAIIDAKGEPYQLSPEQGLLEGWKLVDSTVKSNADVVKKGKEFVAYVKERFNVDVSTLTDEQLYMGSRVEFEDLTFLGYIINADLRLVSRTTPVQQINYYENTKYRGVGYALMSKTDIKLEGGVWTGIMPMNSTIYTDTSIIHTNECDFEEEPHILKMRPLDIHPAKRFNGEYVGANTWEAEVWSSKYGHGVQYAVDMHEIYTSTFVNIFLDTP